MLERDSNGKFVKRNLVGTSVDTNDRKVDPKSCNDDKLSIIQWNLQSNQSQLELWQREYATCDHKDRNDFGQMVSHYSWRVAQWQDLLIRYLEECDDCCKTQTP
jgi:hypothetical protein